MINEYTGEAEMIIKVRNGKSVSQFAGYSLTIVPPESENKIEPKIETLENKEESIIQEIKVPLEQPKVADKTTEQTKKNINTEDTTDESANTPYATYALLAFCVVLSILFFAQKKNNE